MGIHTTIRQKRAAYAQALEAALRNIVTQLAAMPEVEKIILFGSYATGRRDLFTDLDVLVVMDTQKDIINRSPELYQQLQVGVDLDLLVYTPDEFERQKDTRFLSHALKTGRVLYERRPLS